MLTYTEACWAAVTALPEEDQIASAVQMEVESELKEQRLARVWSFPHCTMEHRKERAWGSQQHTLAWQSGKEWDCLHCSSASLKVQAWESLERTTATRWV